MTRDIFPIPGNPRAKPRRSEALAQHLRLLKAADRLLVEARERLRGRARLMRAVRL